MKDEDASVIVEIFSAMRFFPSAEGARIAIGTQIQSMCSDVKQAAWLANRVLTLYGEWPGLREIRAVLCSKFKPADGIEANSTVYLDGMPAEKPGEFKSLPAPAGRLTAAELSPDPEFAEMIKRMGRSKLTGVRPAADEEIREVLKRQQENLQRAKTA